MIFSLKIDCKGRQCFNGGELDPNTCKCVCNGLWNGDDCSSRKFYFYR